MAYRSRSTTHTSTIELRTTIARHAKVAVAALSALGLSAATLGAGVLSGPATAAVRPAPMGVLVNPTFSLGTRGWTETTPSGLLATIADGHTGIAARVTHAGSTAATVILDDAIDTVRRTAAGANYTATAWVRSSKATTVNLRLLERGRTVLGQMVSVNQVGTSWTRVGVTYTARATGATLDFALVGYQQPAGASMDVDDITFTSRTAGWHDEFNGPSLDRTSWTPMNNSRQGAGSNEQSCYLDRPENVALSGGTVQLIGRREDQLSCGVLWPLPRDYSSGFLDTRGKRSFTYGRFELRAKLPTAAANSQGLWSAFWLWPDDEGKGELDVMEAIGTSATRPDESNRVHQYLHYDLAETYPQQGQAYVFPQGEPSDGFHTYALEWNPTSALWFVDGRLTYWRDTTTTPWLASTLNRPMHLLLNLTVGATWPGLPSSDTQLPAVYAIDYVRTYSPAAS